MKPARTHQYERDEGVRTLVAQAIQHARRLGRKIGLCGQAPSDYPDFARFLVDCGIDRAVWPNPAAPAPHRDTLDRHTCCSILH
jgi:phosphoenolpyruvate synthase/pyruvate phosphate dikinase